MQEERTQEVIRPDWLKLIDKDMSDLVNYAERINSRLMQNHIHYSLVPATIQLHENLCEQINVVERTRHILVTRYTKNFIEEGLDSLGDEAVKGALRNLEQQ